MGNYCDACVKAERSAAVMAGFERARTEARVLAFARVARGECPKHGEQGMCSECWGKKVRERREYREDVEKKLLAGEHWVKIDGEIVLLGEKKK